MASAGPTPSPQGTVEAIWEQKNRMLCAVVHQCVPNGLLGPQSVNHTFLLSPSKYLFKTRMVPCWLERGGDRTLVLMTAVWSEEERFGRTT